MDDRAEHAPGTAICLADLVSGDMSVVEGAAQARGKSDVENVLALIENSAVVLADRFGIGRVGRILNAVAHIRVKLLQIRRGTVLVSLITVSVFQRLNDHAVLRYERVRQVACGISDDNIIAHNVLQKVYYVTRVDIANKRMQE